MATKSRGRRGSGRGEANALRELLAVTAGRPQPETDAQRAYATGLGYCADRGMTPAERDGWCLATYGKTFAQLRAAVGTEWADFWDGQMEEVARRFKEWDDRWSNA